MPRPLQYKLHKELRRFSVLVCHRRFGKTIFSINHLIDRALRNKLPMPRYAYIAPTYGQAKRVVWDQLKHYTSKIPGVEVNEGELRVDFPENKARIMLLSAENPVSLKGISLDGAILDEYATMDPATWTEVIRPTLSDRKGFAIFISTPRGHNSFYDLYNLAMSKVDPDWFGQLYRASETKIIDQAELDSARRTMPEEEYEQEYECSFQAALSGAYFGKELSAAEKGGRLLDLPYDPAMAVDTYWDLGINDTTAIWFVQSSMGQHRVIDYFETCGSSLPESIVEMQKRGYVIGRVVLPHDAAVRDLSTGKARVQEFYKLGYKNVTIVPRVGAGHKADSVNAARMILAKTWFDRKKCELGLKMLAQYQRKWNSKNQVYEDAPLHNAASNAADAFQCFAMGVRESSGAGEGFLEKNRRPGGGLQAEIEYDPLSYGGLGVH